MMDELGYENREILRYADRSVEELISSNIEMLNGYYVRHVLPLKKEYDSSAEEQTCALISALGSSLEEYAAEWGDSEELRMAVVLLVIDLLMLSDRDFEECLRLLPDVLRAGLPPVSLLVAGKLTRRVLRGNDKSLDLSRISRGVLPSHAEMLILWVKKIGIAQQQLGLDGIANAPIEIFERFLRPYINEIFEPFLTEGDQIMMLVDAQSEGMQ